MLSIPWLGDPEDQADSRGAFHRACDFVDELIQTDAKVDPGSTYELMEWRKRSKRIVAKNT